MDQQNMVLRKSYLGRISNLDDQKIFCQSKNLSKNKNVETRKLSL